MSILIVGGGKMGLSHLAILSRLIPKSEVVLCDSSLAVRILYKKLGFKTFGSLEDAFSVMNNWTGAVVSTPTSSHYSISKSLLNRGVPLFIEKPLTLNLQCSQELYDLQNFKNIYVQMGLVARYIASFVRVRKIISSGVLGRPIKYQGRMRGNVITRAENNGWRTVFSKGGGCLNEYGPHIIDLCRYFFGDVEEINNVTASQVYSSMADDRISLNWIHGSGCEGEVSLDWCDPTQRKATLAFDIFFETGTLKVTNTDISVERVPGSFINPTLTSILEEPLRPHPVSYYLRGEEYSLQLEAFVNAIHASTSFYHHDLPNDTAATLADGFAVDKLIHELASKAHLS